MSPTAKAAPREEPVSRSHPPTVRAGLVGGGLMAKTHSLAYASLPLVYGDQHLPQVVRRRLADVEQPLAEAAAERYGWDEAATDWREITRAPDIDLVDIATPNDTHAEIAVDAARHGKHVFCEKPLAHQVEDARTMHRAVSEAGVTNQVDFAYRKWPAIQHARQLVARGEIGRVRQLRARYLHDYAADRAVPIGWRFTRSRAGAGSLGDLGSHLIDLARFLVGDVHRVMARTFTFVHERPLHRDAAAGATARLGRVDVDDAAHVWLDFGGGASGTLETNWMATGHKTDLSFEVTGDQGALRFSWLAPNELRFYSELDATDVQGFRSIIIGPQHPGAEAFWPVPGQGLGWGDAFLISVRDLLAAIAAGVPAQPDFLDGLRAVEVVDAALTSAATGGWVKIGGPAPQ
jgi:predicted dehydrogenase